ncbi:hypothetical protein N9N32_00455 [Alphaproteobacteria bacterium]|nr:hypothetical protein [Alphaproteobacteria bacterium]
MTITMKTVLLTIASILISIQMSYAGNPKLFYNADGTSGWKGSYQTFEKCEKAAKRNRYESDEYYCAIKRDRRVERELGW